MDHRLPDGEYPFANTRLPLSKMGMMEAPPELERVLREAATKQGVEIIRDQPVELHCTSENFPEATFLVFWPSGNERLNILAPEESIVGKA